jgi:hypothetical protein
VINKLTLGLILGGFLGVICIVGANLRSPEPLDNWYLFAFWFNRFLMGFVFAMLPINISFTKKIIRGILIGLLVSFAFYSATNFNDLMGFIVGGLYGVIIEVVFHYTAIGKTNVS